MIQVQNFPEYLDVTDENGKFPVRMFFCLKKYPDNMPKKGKLWVAGYYDRQGSGRESFNNYRTVSLFQDGETPEDAMYNLKLLLESLKIL